MRATNTEPRVRLRLALGIGGTLIGCALAAAAAAARPAWRQAVWAHLSSPAAQDAPAAAPPLVITTSEPRTPSATSVGAPLPAASAAVERAPMAMDGPQAVTAAGSPIAMAALGGIQESDAMAAQGPDGRYRNYVAGLAQRAMAGDRGAWRSMLEALTHPGEVPEQETFVASLLTLEVQPDIDGAILGTEGGVFVLKMEGAPLDEHEGVFELKIEAQADGKAVEGEHTFVFTPGKGEIKVPGMRLKAVPRLVPESASKGR